MGTFSEMKKEEGRSRNAEVRRQNAEVGMQNEEKHFRLQILD
jgi:hypothetical protein